MYTCVYITIHVHNKHVLSTLIIDYTAKAWSLMCIITVKKSSCHDRMLYTHMYMCIQHCYTLILVLSPCNFPYTIHCVKVHMYMQVLEMLLLYTNTINRGESFVLVVVLI